MGLEAIEHASEEYVSHGELTNESLVMENSFDYENLKKERTTKVSFKKNLDKNLLKKKVEIVMDKDNKIVGCMIPTIESENDIIIEENQSIEENGTESDEIPDEIIVPKNEVFNIVEETNELQVISEPEIESDGVPDEIPEEEVPVSPDHFRAKKYSVD